MVRELDCHSSKITVRLRYRPLKFLIMKSKKKYYEKSAMNMALADISEYMKENGKLEVGGCEIWNVHPSHLLTKETRYLNKLLGLDIINKTKSPKKTK